MADKIKPPYECNHLFMWTRGEDYVCTLCKTHLPDELSFWLNEMWCDMEKGRRKIRWLRRMLAWAVRLAKFWKRSYYDQPSAATLDFFGREVRQLRSENESLRQAGRGLVKLLDTHIWDIDDYGVVREWRKVDPQ